MVIIDLSSCEKDDICVEGDTPLLVIGFYDIADTTFKTVTNLRIRALDNDSIFNSATAYGFSDRSNSPDSITIPLRIAEPTTTFEFISNSAADDEDAAIETGIIDTVTFNYVVNEKFISRACGFVANFNDLDTTRQVFSTDWIKGINILDSTITNSNLIHVQIFH
jgi:hypothetical protein